MTLSDFLTGQGLSHAKFAKMIGVSQVTVTRYVNGERIPRRKHLDRIKKVTKGAVTPNDLLQDAA